MAYIAILSVVQTVLLLLVITIILPSYFNSQCEQGVMDLEEIESELLFWESDLPHPASLRNESRSGIKDGEVFQLATSL